LRWWPAPMQIDRVVDSNCSVGRVPVTLQCSRGGGHRCRSRGAQIVITDVLRDRQQVATSSGGSARLEPLPANGSASSTRHGGRSKPSWVAGAPTAPVRRAGPPRFVRHPAQRDPRATFSSPVEHQLGGHEVARTRRRPGRALAVAGPGAGRGAGISTR
jgi:hypothetical protein